MSTRPLITVRAQTVLAAMLGIGVLGFIFGLVTNPSRMWPAFLTSAFYFLTLGLGALVFVAIQHVSNAGWSSVIRRVPEAMGGYLPLGAALMLLTFFGRHSIYEWSHGLTGTSEAMKAKQAFLSTPFFFGRMIVLLAIWVGFALWLRRESRLQEQDGSLHRIGRIKTLSAAFLAIFAVTFSIASFDWLMSVEPEFYSTIYAFYCFSGLFLSGIAAITVVVILLRRGGLLPQVNEEHLHALGKLVFGFSTFWAYIWLSQYLLIYYANIPEEAIYYIRRTNTPGWKFLFLSNLLLNWIIPFLLLLPRRAKRSESILLAGCAIVLVGHWLDLYLMVFPATGAQAMPSVVDLALWLGFFALFTQVTVRNLSRMPLLPANDPYLEESLALHALEPPPSPAVVWAKDASRALVLATIAFAISFAIWGLVGSLAPRFREMYGLSAFETAVLIAIPVLLGSLGRVPMGILADRFGGRLVFGVLLLCCVVPSVGISFTNSYTALVAWALLIGIGGTTFSVGVAFVSKWFAAKEQGLALGVYGMGNIGQSVAVFGAPALVAATGDWRVPFWLFGALAGVFGIIFLLLARNAAVRIAPKKLGEYLAVFKRQPMAWALSLFYFLTFGGFVALSIYLPTLLKDIFSLTATDAGARVAGFVVVATAMRPVGGFLADRFGGATVLSLVLGFLVVLPLGLTSPNIFLFTLGALGSAAMLGLGNGAVFKLVPEYFPRETGTVTGLVGAAGGLGGFFPPLVLGVIKGQTGSYALGFVFLSGFALMCLAINYIILIRKRVDKEREAAGW